MSIIAGKYNTWRLPSPNVPWYDCIDADLYRREISTEILITFAYYNASMEAPQ